MPSDNSENHPDGTLYNARDSDGASNRVACLRVYLQGTTAILTGGGNEELDDSAPFVELEGEDCKSCSQPAATNGEIKTVPTCPSSGNCEQYWVDTFPQHYAETDDQGQVHLSSLATACGNCAVKIELRLSDSGQPERGITRGECHVIAATQRYNDYGRTALNSTEIPDIDKFEEFDGEGSERDERLSQGSQAATMQSTDATCAGNFLSYGIDADMRPQVGMYECPRSILSGEHCLQKLVVTSSMELTTPDGQDWQTNCLFRNSTPDQR